MFKTFSTANFRAHASVLPQLLVYSSQYLSIHGSQGRTLTLIPFHASTFLKAGFLPKSSIAISTFTRQRATSWPTVNIDRSQCVSILLSLCGRRLRNNKIPTTIGYPFFVSSIKYVLRGLRHAGT